MAVTYYVALPFIRTEDGTAPGEAQECQSEAAAIRRAEGMSRDPANAGAVAFKRVGDPNLGEFSDAVVLKKFGDVSKDLSALILQQSEPQRWPQDSRLHGVGRPVPSPRQCGRLRNSAEPRQLLAGLPVAC